ENIMLKRSKCQFASPTVTYLGHELSHNRVKPLYNNVKAILDFPAPKNVKQLRGFLGKVNYYHRFFPNRAKMLSPLYELTKKDVPYEWSQEAQEAFDTVKEVLTTAPALSIYNPKAKTVLYTDASRIGIGAILKQEQEDGEMHPVGYFSKRLLSYQRNYSTTELELLAIVDALDYFYYYLYGIQFVVVTDHQPLKWLKKISKPNTRIFNWSLRISQYQFTAEYRSGKKNKEADCLSRNP